MSQRTNGWSIIFVLTNHFPALRINLGLLSQSPIKLSAVGGGDNAPLPLCFCSFFAIFTFVKVKIVASILTRKFAVNVFEKMPSHISLACICLKWKWNMVLCGCGKENKHRRLDNHLWRKITYSHPKKCLFLSISSYVRYYLKKILFFACNEVHNPRNVTRKPVPSSSWIQFHIQRMTGNSVSWFCKWNLIRPTFQFFQFYT